MNTYPARCCSCGGDCPANRPHCRDCERRRRVARLRSRVRRAIRARGVKS